MSGYRLLFSYSFRLCRREWRRFVLPLLSLAVTSTVVLLILLLTGSGTKLLVEQSRELQGGDIVLESTLPFDGEVIFSEENIFPESISKQLSFSGTLESKADTAPFSITAADNNFPLYGTFGLEGGASYRSPRLGEVYLDQAGAERLQVKVGDSISFGTAQLEVVGITVSEPTSLLAGFRFTPRAIMSQDSFAISGVDPALLRVEYVYAASVPSLSKVQIESLRDRENKNPAIDVDIAGQDRRGLQAGLSTVSDFLAVAVLITAILAAVNVYVSTLYLVTAERKSLAVLLALGLEKRNLIAILGLALLYVVVISGGIGAALGIVLFTTLQMFALSEYLVALPTPNIELAIAISFSLIALISIGAFLPAARSSLALRPKQILIGGEAETTKQIPCKSFFMMTAAALSPLLFLAMYLFSDVTQGLLVVAGVMVAYSVVAVIYFLLLSYLYRKRERFQFLPRSIISQKRADGLFGVVSFASLFVALVSVVSLTLLQVSLERFLVRDLANTAPTTYVLDVQPSQKEDLTTAFPDLELFSNIGARILEIDGVRIQDELSQPDSDIDRELGREFNLTARTELLSTETIVAGNWGTQRPGEISVDQDFAKQANIDIGSRLVFSIQGIQVEGVVTSLRDTDSRSGLPFFYFVLSPDDIGQFPSVYFGYSYYEPDKQAALGRYLADSMPNVSMIETQSIGPLLKKLFETLLVLVFIITLPPLLIATLLISMLVIASYAERRRQGARLRALGLDRTVYFWYYLLETVFVTVLASAVAYLLGVLVTYLVGTFFLKLTTVAWFDSELILLVFIIITFVIGLAFYLFKTDTMPLRELLSYE